MDRRPPLAVSPRRLRPRRTQQLPPQPQPPRGSTASVQTPPSTKKISRRDILDSARSNIPLRASVSVESPSRLPEYQTISSELMAMAKRAKEDFGIGDQSAGAVASLLAPSSPLFERGRFYEVYSARRNERLKRKKGEEVVSEEEAVAQDPGVAVELAKRRSSKKAAEGIRKSVPPDFSVSRLSTLRSSVRSSREMKKAAAAATATVAISEISAAAGRRTVTRYGRKI